MIHMYARPVGQCYGFIRTFQFGRLSVLLALCMLAGCANLQTVNRTTDFNRATTGRAIHLDAQQRLLITSGLKFCAEPSPDALASYASALGFGITGANKNSASTANALQSSAASIGLRTQSITLMRDALYRMCEAQVNGAIDDVAVATFLTRSQDLTAVVLAIEQLTGAVAASQVVLTGGNSASASALLLSNQQIMEQAKKDEAEAKESVAKARKSHDDAVALLGSKDAELKTAQTVKATTDASATATAAEKKAAKVKVETLTKELADLTADADAKKTKLDSSKQSLVDATKVRERIEDQRDSSYTAASATTDSAGAFSPTIQRNSLSAEATREVATAVNNMVQSVLAKSYYGETCIAFLTKKPADSRVTADTGKGKDFFDACIALITQGAELERAKQQSETERVRAQK